MAATINRQRLTKAEARVWSAYRELEDLDPLSLVTISAASDHLGIVPSAVHEHVNKAWAKGWFITVRTRGGRSYQTVRPESE